LCSLGEYLSDYFYICRSEKNTWLRRILVLCAKTIINFIVNRTTLGATSGHSHSTLRNSSVYGCFSSSGILVVCVGLVMTTLSEIFGIEKKCFLKVCIFTRSTSV
jgi:hypothetical protein